MDTSVKKQSYQRKSALIAGISLIIMTITAFFSYGFVHGSLVVQGDASATFNNIKLSNMLFKAEIFGWVIILITDIVVAWAFYIFLKPINQSLSLLGAWLRLTYATILGTAILNLIFVLLLSKNTDYLSLFKIDQLQAHMMLFLEAFEFIWSIGLIIFGGHLMIVGYLTLKSDRIPKVISILLLLAAIGYIVINLFSAILSQYDTVISILKIGFSVPMIVGELGFGIWLLFRGGKVPKGV
ncbi:hypothetical protein CON65_03015 [Bacillus pseudomycoides]|uniref:DUF4386 domain-containing protein n=1 Tax=Bacillus pseudomycoides TaxID=64104 RepID=A0AA91VFR2_9BACI|nr:MULTISPECIES: DUF4386 domain-containing protein [Bacillus]PEB52240.1 hypothetical protein COO03_12740 [Bacillus sp. AFS098217]PED84082.1 hypothetical protein CON65_03015 [Bacillus pseudomycoides]PEU11658.1 hypothetical protein CN524_14105 [Bacillus sp. AFS019443]PEU12838.1 hypothetical protein CN525_20230 [Bacillus sp. AFS014408]PFW64733.1 hypothetical protein COL20_03610 [Bacillus sp. AFS075034]